MATIAIAASLLAALSPFAFANDDGRGAAETAREMRAMRAQMRRMQAQIDALEARLNAAGAGAKASAAPTPGRGLASGGSAAPTQPPMAPPSAAEAAVGAPPPGVTAAGAPMPESAAPPGVTIGESIKALLPGAVSGPQAPHSGALASAGNLAGQGVIVPGVQGVSQVFIPDIGAIGDFLFQQSDFHHNDPRYDPGADKFNVRDTQIIFYSPIDPYTNALISIDKPDNGPFDIEEAYLVFDKLPWGVNIRAGQFRPVFGLLNESDTFQLPMVNRPQAIARYITQDGFVEPGVDASAYIPNPWQADIKADVNILSGVNTISFDRNQGRNFDFAYMGTLIYSRELFDSGFMSGGFSMAGGPGPGGQTYLEDPFLQMQYAPDQRHIWTLDFEGMLAERKGVGDHGVKRGVYSLLDYNFWLRWHAGFLLDLADRPYVASGTEAGVSPILTYFVSDNTRLRLQYTHTTGSGPEQAANQLFMQATFSLGNLKPLD
jgi:hypothetical protein